MGNKRKRFGDRLQSKNKSRRADNTAGSLSTNSESELYSNLRVASDNLNNIITTNNKLLTILFEALHAQAEEIAEHEKNFIVLDATALDSEHSDPINMQNDSAGTELGLPDIGDEIFADIGSLPDMQIGYLERFYEKMQPLELLKNKLEDSIKEAIDVIRINLEQQAQASAMPLTTLEERLKFRLEQANLCTQEYKKSNAFLKEKIIKLEDANKKLGSEHNKLIVEFNNAPLNSEQLQAENEKLKRSFAEVQKKLIDNSAVLERFLTTKAAEMESLNALLASSDNRAKDQQLANNVMIISKVQAIAMNQSRANQNLKLQIRGLEAQVTRLTSLSQSANNSSTSAPALEAIQQHLSASDSEKDKQIVKDAIVKSELHKMVQERDQEIASLRGQLQKITASTSGYQEMLFRDFSDYRPENSSSSAAQLSNNTTPIPGLPIYRI